VSEPAISSASSIPDQLMRRVQGDDDDVAFAGLVERYSAKAHRLAHSICHDDDGTDLAVQEAFASMWTSRATYRASRGGVETWMMSIVRHRAIAVARGDALRASRTARVVEFDRLLGEDADVADVALVAEDTDRLRGLLLRLPATQREVIGLAFYGELTHREISEHLGLPPGTIKGRMRLGLEKLRAEIDS